MNHTPMNQPLILPTPGYVLPSPGLNVFSPYQPAAGIGPTFSLMPQQHGVPSPVVAQNNSSSSFFMRFAQNPQTSPPTGLSTEGSPNTEKDFRIITWEELRHLFPKPGPEGRVESGLLSDGRAYAQKTAKRDNYFLFPSKSAYILYFIHYYFSRDNLDRDQTIRRMMIENTAVSVDKLIQAPRLASIGTTVSDLEVAIHNSNILCLVDLPDGKRGVKRYDGYPGSIAATTGVSSATSAVDSKHRMSGDSTVYADRFQSPGPLDANSIKVGSIESVGAVPAVPTSPFHLTPVSPSAAVGVPEAIPRSVLSPPSTTASAGGGLAGHMTPSATGATSPSQSDFRRMSRCSSNNTPSPIPQASTEPIIASTSFSSPPSQSYLVQGQTVLPTYGGGDYPLQLQTTSCAFSPQIPVSFVGRPPRTAPSVSSIDAAIAAVAAMSIGQGASPVAATAPVSHVVPSAAPLQPPPGLHMLCPQLGERSHIGAPTQQHPIPAPYRGLLTAPDQSSMAAGSAAQHTAAGGHQDATFAALTALAQVYQQQQQNMHRGPPVQVQPGQPIYPYQMHLQTAGRRSTPPPNHPTHAYYHLAAVHQSLQFPQLPQPPQNQAQFFSMQKPAPGALSAFPFTAAAGTVDGGYAGFRGGVAAGGAGAGPTGFPPQHFISESVLGNTWDTANALAAAAAVTTGIQLQYTGNPSVGGLPMAFDHLSVHNPHRPQIVWHQHVNPVNAAVKIPGFDTSPANTLPSMPSTTASASSLVPLKPVEVHPCAADDPSIVAVTDSGEAGSNLKSVPMSVAMAPSATAATMSTTKLHTESNTVSAPRSSKGKYKLHQKPHASRVITSVDGASSSSTSSPPRNPSSSDSKDRPQSALSLPVQKTTPELKQHQNTEPLLACDLGTSLHSNPD
uniref:HTH La-type RNA-binding domain-containing protein n=1 Tax=Schistocephalus solidus TaxID=70667 RepID=A0A0X3PHX6_SCHSO